MLSAGLLLFLVSCHATSTHVPALATRQFRLKCTVTKHHHRSIASLELMARPRKEPNRTLVLSCRETYPRTKVSSNTTSPEWFLALMRLRLNFGLTDGAVCSPHQMCLFAQRFYPGSVRMDEPAFRRTWLEVAWNRVSGRDLNYTLFLDSTLNPLRILNGWAHLDGRHIIGKRLMRGFERW